jgi:hypothetical protein
VLLLVQCKNELDVISKIQMNMRYKLINGRCIGKNFKKGRILFLIAADA